MDQSISEVKKEVRTAERVLALSRQIAANPKFYSQLAVNPYSSKTMQLGSERFPGVSITDIIWATICAEPEAQYERNFKQLSPLLQEEGFYHQANTTIKITQSLQALYTQHLAELQALSDPHLYEVLFRTAFETTNLSEIEQRYAQGQRRQIKLLILQYMVRLKNIGGYVPIDADQLPPRKSFLKMALVIFGSIPIFYLSFVYFEYIINSGQTKNIEFAQEAVAEMLPPDSQKTMQVVPVRLKIARIDLDVAIEYTGLTAEGAMEVPNNTIDVGWYELGPVPGEIGSAVISGHYNGEKGEPGVFNKLDELMPGDTIEVLNGIGITTTFVVKESQSYAPGYVDEVFYPPDEGIHLNLITCDGTWDKTKKSYSKRLVVFTDIMD